MAKGHKHKEDSKMKERWKIATQELGLTDAQIANYSVLRAVQTLYDPVGVKAPFERDLSDQICKRDNRETRGILIPHEILDHRYCSHLPKGGHILTDQVVRGLPPLSNQTTARQKRSMVWGTQTSGGYLVDEELRTLIEVLVEKTLALQNCPVLNVEGAPVNIPGQTTRVNMQFLREDTITFAEMEFNAATTQTAVNALTGDPKFAVITVSSAKYLALHAPTDDTKRKMERIEVGNKFTVGGQTYTVAAEWDATNERIQINSSAVTTGLTNGTDYEIVSPNAVEETALTFNNIQFQPRFLKVMVHLSRTLRLLATGTDIEMLTRNDIAIGIAKSMDTAVIYGDGAANGAPRGIKNTTGINSITYNANEAYKQVVEAFAMIGVQNIPTNNLKWLASWYWPTEMKLQKRLGEQTRRPIMGADGKVVGADTEVSSQITGTSAVLPEAYLGNWMESAITLWQDLELEVDPYTLLHQGIDRIVANLTMDFNTLRPKAFTRVGGA